MGRWRRRVSRAVGAWKRLRTASEPPARSVPPANLMETVWYIGEQTMCRSSGSKCQTAASSSATALAVASSHRPVVTPFGLPVVPDV